MKNEPRHECVYQACPHTNRFSLESYHSLTCTVGSSLFKVQIWGKVLEENIHVFGDSKGEERNDVHETLSEGQVRLHKGTLYVLQEHLKLVISFHLVLWGRDESLQWNKKNMFVFAMLP